jgi:hypothetical protein
MTPLSLYERIRLGLVRVTTRSPPLHRFLAKVDKRGPLHPVLLTRCWVWCGSTRGATGYGQVCVKYRLVQAHRFAYELQNGPVPDGLLVLHKCDNKLCVRPSHLFLGTHADNMRDRDGKGRGARGERVGNARLTEQQVRWIRRVYRPWDERFGLVALARKLHVHRLAVCNIVHRKTWRHVK